MKAMKVVNGIVINIAKFPDASGIPPGWVPYQTGVNIGWLDNGDGTFSPPANTTPTLTAEQIRDNALSNLSHDFGDGRVIQCGRKPFPDESHIRNAIEQLERTGATSRQWINADNTVVTLSLAELKDVLASFQDQAATILDDYLDTI